MSTKILVVTRDRAVAEEVIDRFEGSDVSWVQDPYNAVSRIWEGKYDLLILDDNLDRSDTLAVQIRKTKLVSGRPLFKARAAFWMSSGPHPEDIAETWVANLTELELVQ